MNENDLNALNAMTLIQAAVIEIAWAISDNDAFCGYDGSPEQVTALFDEVTAVVNQLIHPDLRDVDNIVETWFEVQNSIGSGELEVDWYLA